MLLLIVFYKVSFKKEHTNKFVNWTRFIGRFIMFLSISMGLSFHNTIAVLEGYSGKKSAFIRTPKFNVKSKKDNWKNNIYLSHKINLITVIEGFLSLYFLCGIISAFYLNDFGLFPFHTLLFLGFGLVFISSVFQLKSISVNS